MVRIRFPPDASQTNSHPNRRGPVGSWGCPRLGTDPSMIEQAARPHEVANESGN